MSRIGRLPIPVPSGVDVTIDGQRRHRQGPQGHPVAHRRRADHDRAGATAQLAGHPPERRARRQGALHGLSRTLVTNMVVGVTEGYSKTLEIVGTGYRVQAKGRDLEFALGFSHPVPVDAAGGHHLHRRGPDPVRGRRASTSRRSARSPPTSASCASPTRTRARACATRARSSAARPERLVSRP